MSRTALKILVAALVAVAATAAWGLDPHLDPSLLPAGCASCHRGHGESRSPMLPATQSEVCLSCHGSQAQLDESVLRGILAPGSSPPLLSSTLSRPFTHALDERAYSRHEVGVVTCTSCHSPHRSAAARTASASAGVQRRSTRDPSRFEFELCQGCHGSERGGAQDMMLDVGRLSSARNRSAHPIEAPSLDRSPSVLSSFAGKEINCTDCHGNSEPAGPSGPHGSAVRFILRADYTTTDGNQESVSAYALCYRCHDRERVLDSSLFPLHRMHVVERRASCATCHSGHGSVENRALIRFGEETFLAGVAPSVTTGRLAFVSDVPGSGACYLSCHGRDHAPESYGAIPTEPPATGVPSAADPRDLEPR